MAIYITFYIGIIITGLIFSKKKNQKYFSRLFCNLVFIVMSLITCLRGISVGEDTAHYVEWFQEYCAMPSITSLFNYERDVEIGYSLINYSISRITDKPQVLIAVMALIINFLHIRFIRLNSKNIYSSMALYLSLNFFFTSMNSWRQFIAMGICFWMFPLLLKRKYIKSLLVLLCAFCFHDTVIIFGFAIFVCALFNHKKNRLILLIIAGIISFFALPLLIKIVLKILPAYESYFQGEGGGYFGELELLFIIIQFVIIMMTLLNKYLREDKRITLLSSLLLCNILISLYGLRIPHIFRLNFYFKYFLIIMIPELIFKFENSGKKYMSLITRRITLIGCCLLFGYYISTNPGNVVPYKTFVRLYK